MLHPAAVCVIEKQKTNKQNNNKKKHVKGVSGNKNIAFQLWIFFLLWIYCWFLYAGSQEKELKTVKNC